MFYAIFEECAAANAGANGCIRHGAGAVDECGAERSESHAQTAQRGDGRAHAVRHGALAAVRRTRRRAHLSTPAGRRSAPDSAALPLPHAARRRTRPRRPASPHRPHAVERRHAPARPVRAQRRLHTPQQFSLETRRAHHVAPTSRVAPRRIS